MCACMYLSVYVLSVVSVFHVMLINTHINQCIGHIHVGDCYDLVPIGVGPHCVSEQMIAAGREIVLEFAEEPEEEIDPDDHEAQQRKLLRSRQEKEREAFEAKKIKDREEKEKQEEENKKVM